MSTKQPLGVTLTVPGGQEATGVYSDENGTVVFETDAPYLLEDGKSLQLPLSVKIVSGPIFTDSMGNAQTALAVSGLATPDADGWILAGAVWNDSGVWKDVEAWEDA